MKWFFFFFFGKSCSHFLLTFFTLHFFLLFSRNSSLQSVPVLQFCNDFVFLYITSNVKCNGQCFLDTFTAKITFSLTFIYFFIIWSFHIDIGVTDCVFCSITIKLAKFRLANIFFYTNLVSFRCVVCAMLILHADADWICQTISLFFLGWFKPIA